MPKVQAQGTTMECIRSAPPTPNICLYGCNHNFVLVGAYTDVRKANERQILRQNGVDLYNSGAKVINCRNCRRIGSGTCAVLLEGEVSPNWRDRRHSPPPPPITKGAFSLSNQGLGQCEGDKI